MLFHIMGRWQSKAMQHQTIRPGKQNSSVWVVESDLCSWRGQQSVLKAQSASSASLFFLLWAQTRLYGSNICDNTFAVLLECKLKSFIPKECW